MGEYSRFKHLDKLANSPSKNKSIRKVMKKIGKKMADKTHSPQAAEMLKQYAAQVVAMTDLPIEWLAKNGVHLGFTHDVCRLPETPVTGLLPQYMESPYTVLEYILQKALVFGNENPDFVRLQHPVRELSGKLGFKIRTCLDKASFSDWSERGDHFIHASADYARHGSLHQTAAQSRRGRIQENPCELDGLHLASHEDFLHLCTSEVSA